MKLIISTFRPARVELIWSIRAVEGFVRTDEPPLVTGLHLQKQQQEEGYEEELSARNIWEHLVLVEAVCEQLTNSRGAAPGALSTPGLTL